VASLSDKEFYPICFLADVFNCLTCPWFDWDTVTGVCRNHGAGACRLKPGKPSTPLGGTTVYQ
jgi:hypothetical protein